MSKAPFRAIVLMAFIIHAVSGLAPRPAVANTAAVCDAAAQIAARQSGVPLGVLRAISLTETGRKRDGAFEPWPWTVNMEGKGVWFDTPAEALSYVQKHFDRGARSFDVGCFQINYRWHGEAFDSIADMFDPIQNSAYAARFLTELYAEFGDWSKAAGAYHSRTPKFANKYTARFDRIRASLGDIIVAPEPSPPSGDQQLARTAEIAPRPQSVERVNRYPLLQTVPGQAHLGSLVSLPSHAPQGSLLIGNAPQKGLLQ